MVIKKRRRFDRAYKLETVRLALGSGKPQKEVARDLGVNPESLYRWIRDFRTDPEQSFPGLGNLKERDQEVEQLRRQVTRLQGENAFLKKVSAYFVKSPK